MSERLVGKTVDSFEVLGQERNGSGEWVGADMLLRIRDNGNFFLRVVTKAEFASETVLDWQKELKEVGVEDFDPKTAPQLHLDFVLNDRYITDDILEAKFKGREILPDLAASLWTTDEVE